VESYTYWLEDTSIGSKLLKPITIRMSLKGNPCDLLNKTNSAAMKLWDVDNSTLDSEKYRLIAKVGQPAEYNVAAIASSDFDILKTLDKKSKVPLIKYLSDVPKFKSIVTISGTSNILYIVGIFYDINNNYIKSYNKIEGTATQLLSDSNLWDSTDMDADNKISSSPKSAIGKLMNMGIVLTPNEIFTKNDFGSTPPGSGTESLIYLYNFEAKGSVNLTSAQVARKKLLETKNLKFFGAFLCEYCYYRSRYDSLLKEYFEVHGMPATGSGKYVAPEEVTGSIHQTLFNGKGTAENQYSGTNTSQRNYLKVLAYHMALLNTKMSDMNRLLVQLGSLYATINSDIKDKVDKGTIAGNTKDLNKKIMALNDSADSMNSYLSERDFHNAAMEYSDSKNRYSTVLLGLYAFLNIAAVAMIVHVSRS